jgi:hypothetical protein
MHSSSGFLFLLLGRVGCWDFFFVPTVFPWSFYSVPIMFPTCSPRFSNVPNLCPKVYSCYLYSQPKGGELEHLHGCSVCDLAQFAVAGKRCSKQDGASAPAEKSVIRSWLLIGVFWLAHHNDWSRWFAISSPPHICCHSFSLMGGVIKESIQLNLDVKKIFARITYWAPLEILLQHLCFGTVRSNPKLFLVHLYLGLGV